MSTSEERALNLIRRADLEPEDQGPLIADIARALRAERAAVWEKAAKKFDEKFHATDRRLDITRDYRVDEFYNWLRIKAKEAQP